MESLVYDLSGIKLEMAENINDQLEAVGFVNLGVEARPNLIVLNRTKMPAVLVEAGFINSNTDNTLFDQNFDDIAQAIASGILDTLKPTQSVPDPSVYYVQVGSFRNPAYANRLLNELLEQNYTASIAEEDGFFRVRVGSFDDLEDAAEMERSLKRAGSPTVIVG